MMKLFLVLSILSVNAFASEERELILEKHLKSGYVSPEHAFQKDCTIYRNGDVEVVLMTGGTASGFTAKISSRKVFEIRQLIQVARHFKIVNGPVACDIGDHIVTGHRHGQSVLIKDQRDCTTYKWRKGWAATRLKAIARNICQF